MGPLIRVALILPRLRLLSITSRLAIPTAAALKKLSEKFMTNVNKAKPEENIFSKKNLDKILKDSKEDVIKENPEYKEILENIKKPNPRIGEKNLKDLENTNQMLNNNTNLPKFDKEALFLLPLIPTTMLLNQQPASSKENFDDIMNNTDGIVSDPIIFDLNNKGFNLTSIENGTYFDHDNDGFYEASTWFSTNNALLVVDLNENDIIDNATELLTHEELIQYDSNKDGIIDSNDECFNNLRLFMCDGTILSLNDVGINSININTSETSILDENGNYQFAIGTYTKVDGTQGNFGEFLLQIDPSNSIESYFEVSDEIKDLPPLTFISLAIYLLQGLLISKRIERLLFNPFALATVLMSMYFSFFIVHTHYI